MNMDGSNPESQALSSSTSAVILLEPCHSICIAVYKNSKQKNSSISHQQSNGKHAELRQLQIAFITISINHDMILSKLQPYLMSISSNIQPLIVSNAETSVKNLFFGYKLEVCFRNMGKIFYTQKFRNLIANQKFEDCNSLSFEISLIGSRKSGSGLSEILQNVPQYIWKTDYFRGSEFGIFVMDVVLWNAEFKVLILFYDKYTLYIYF